MAYLPLLSFLFLLIVGAVHSDVILQEYKQKHILQINSTNINMLTKYSCKKTCMEDPSCKALSTKVMANGKLKCDYSTEKPNEEELEDSTNSTTFVKNACESPFKLIKNVGCIMLSDDTKNFEDATKACPKGSRLYSPATLGIFEHLRQHLLQLKEESSDTSDDIYIGMKMKETTSNWEFLHGGNVGQKGVGEYPFVEEDPHGDGPCARMNYDLPGNYFYHLADKACSEEYHYLCQVLV